MIPLIGSKEGESVKLRAENRCCLPGAAVIRWCVCVCVRGRENKEERKKRRRDTRAVSEMTKNGSDANLRRFRGYEKLG